MFSHSKRSDYLFEIILDRHLSCVLFVFQPQYVLILVTISFVPGGRVIDVDHIVGGISGCPIMALPLFKSMAFSAVSLFDDVQRI